MLVTVTFDIISKKTKAVILAGCDIDVEITPEEYQRITESFETYLFRGMSEDRSLNDICNKCYAIVNEWSEECSEEYDEECFFDYPIEVRADHAKETWHAGFEELTNDELIPTNAKLYKNADGTYTVRSSYRDK